jgi:hypothetical protein
MRRILVLAVAALALLGVVAPGAFAQAPTPTFKISGLVDQMTTYASNVSNYDGDLSARDKQWYGRTRGRFDFIGEVGKAKAVLGIEIDMAYGQTGSNDSNIVAAGGAATTAVVAPFGASGGFDINTDSRAIIEIKWLYTEFEVPLIPVPTVMRLGAMPFGGAATYKLATYANGDFAGLQLVSTITPNVKVNFTYVQAEESLAGPQIGSRRDAPGGTFSNIPGSQARGDDFAIIVAPEVTPFKGLDIKPMYSYFQASGTTSGSSRQGRGGVGTGAEFTPTSVSNAGPAGIRQWGVNEDRHTVGVDTRLRMGPFSLDPTILYQFGHRDVIVQNNSLAVASGKTPGTIARADLDAWLLDLRAGFQLGPLLLEALYLFTTGNGDKDTTLDTVHYFQPLSTDTSYLGDWGPQLTALGLDYLSALGEAGRAIAYPGVAIGWDKYGRHQIGARATYALTPALSMTGGVNVHLTHRAIYADTTAPLAGAGLLPNFAAGGSNDKSNYVGTELNLGLTWRFAPGLAWDNAFGYMFAGEAMNAMVPGPVSTRGDAKDPYILTSRVRFTF